MSERGVLGRQMSAEAVAILRLSRGIDDIDEEYRADVQVLLDAIAADLTCRAHQCRRLAAEKDARIADLEGHVNALRRDYRQLYCAVLDPRGH